MIRLGDYIKIDERHFYIVDILSRGRIHLKEGEKPKEKSIEKEKVNES